MVNLVYLETLFDGIYKIPSKWVHIINPSGGDIEGVAS